MLWEAEAVKVEGLCNPLLGSFPALLAEKGVGFVCLCRSGLSLPVTGPSLSSSQRGPCFLTVCKLKGLNQ